MDAQVAPAQRERSGSVWEVVAISLAWPLALARFVTGLLTDNAFETLQGLGFFLVVFFYTLVRLYQLRRID
jgi:hypothetical protein